jgi:bifunctional DNase/RNase
LDVRPSDAIVMALKFDAPICVVEEVADKQMALIYEAGLTEESLLQRFQELQIEDVLNLSA